MAALRAKGVVKAGTTCMGSLSWGSGNSVAFVTDLTNPMDMYLRLTYSIRKPGSSTATDYDYRIPIVTRPSNLGVGNILLFSCPMTGRLCRTLYRAYGDKWGHREAHGKRIYYSYQAESKRWKANGMYFYIKDQLQPLQKLRNTDTYKGKQTRRSQRTDKLVAKRNEMDKKRLTIGMLPKWMQAQILASLKA